MTSSRLIVAVATLDHLPLATPIAAAIDAEVARGAAGMARRSPALLRRAIRRGNAVLALDGAGWAGFCYLAPWRGADGGRLVATSALIVAPAHRGRGVARRLKERALALTGERYPGATPFGLTTSAAVIAINRDLGFRDASYDELPADPEFWQGCASCPFHTDLIARRRRSCHCTAMLRPPPGPAS